MASQQPLLTRLLKKEISARKIDFIEPFFLIYSGFNTFRGWHLQIGSLFGEFCSAAISVTSTSYFAFLLL